MSQQRPDKNFCLKIVNRNFKPDTITQTPDVQSSDEEDEEDGKKEVRLTRAEARTAAAADFEQLKATVPDQYQQKARQDSKWTAQKLIMMVATYAYIVDLKIEHGIPLSGYVVQVFSDRTPLDEPSNDSNERRRSERRYFHMLRNALPRPYKDRIDDLEVPEIQDKVLIAALEFINDIKWRCLVRPVIY